MNYRADIDGLRAIAVLLVLFFHVQLAGFSGGFLGVDVFFVISGFLITTNILQSRLNNTFSYSEFYKKRFMRLYPAFAVMSVVTLLAGLVLLTPLALKSLVESQLSASFYISNIYFFLTQGSYFSASAHEAPLLHTWSLSVEEQFYIVAPLALALLMKVRGKSAAAGALVFVFALSVAASYVLTSFNAKLGYYAVVSRAHEFLFGCILAAWLVFAKSEKKTLSTHKANMLFVAGALLLLICVVFISDLGPFPGLAAVPFCIAVTMILLAGENKHAVSHVLLGNVAMRTIGKWSYSLYLYHWPIVAYLHVSGVSFTWYVQVAVIVASFIMAYLSYTYVEQAFRRVRFSHLHVFGTAGYLGGASMLLLVWFFSDHHQYLPERFDKAVSEHEYYLDLNVRNSCHGQDLNTVLSNPCLIGENENVVGEGVLWGDSHANHFVEFTDELAKASGITALPLTKGNCPPLPGVYVDAQGGKEACISRNQAILDYILENKPHTVYLAAAWGAYPLDLVAKGTPDVGFQQVQHSLTSMLSNLVEADINVVMYAMAPRMRQDLSRCALKKKVYSFVNHDTSCRFEAYALYADSDRRVLETVTQKFGSKIKVIDVTDYVCHDGHCLTTLNDMPLYTDSNHLSVIGSRMLGQRFVADNK